MEKLTCVPATVVLPSGSRRHRGLLTTPHVLSRTFFLGSGSVGVEQFLRFTKSSETCRSRHIYL